MAQPSYCAQVGRLGLPAGGECVFVGSAAYHILKLNSDLVLGGTFPALSIDDIDFIKPWTGFAAAFSAGIMQNALNVFTAGGAIAVLSSLDVMIAGTVHERLSFQRTDGNRDLIANGWGNLICGLLGGLPGAGSVTCTTNAYRAGGRTSVAAILSSFQLILVALLIGEALNLVPEMVISGLLIVVGIEQIDKALIKQISGLLRSKFLYWRYVAPDLVLTSMVVITGLVYSLLHAIGIGIILSLTYFAFRQGRSFVRRTLRGDTTHSRTYRDPASKEYLKQYGGRLAILELGGALFFGSTDQLEQEIDALVSDGVDYVILDMRHVSSIDTTGVEALKGLYVRLGAEGIFLAISHVVQERRDVSSNRQPFSGSQRREFQESREIWRKLKENDALDIIEHDRFYVDMDTALAECEDRILEDAKKHTPSTIRVQPTILTGLSKAEIRQVRKKMSRSLFTKGELIFSQGEDGNDFYFLLRGRADVVIDLVGTDRKARIHSLRPGTLFGEMVLLDNGKRSASVIAVENCDCYRLSIACYQQLKTESPDLAMKLLENLGKMFSGRLREANALIRELEN